MDTLPNDLLLHVLSYARASTLIRLTMTCQWLQKAATQVASDKVFGAIRYEQLDETDYLPWEWTAEQPLAMLFRSELDAMLRFQVEDELWKDPGCLVFRLTEADVQRALHDDNAMLVYYGYGDRLTWLHHQGDYDEYDGEDALAPFSLLPFESDWQTTNGCDYLVYTQHLPLHPKYGRPTIDAGELERMLDGERTPHLQVEQRVPLCAWFREAHEDERDKFEADARQADAATLLSRFSWRPHKHRLHYGWCHGARVFEREVEPLLSTLPVPSWQRRPSPFEVEAQRQFYHTTFDRTEMAADPFGGLVWGVRVHRAVMGSERKCWYRCTLSFFDAVAKKEKR